MSATKLIPKGTQKILGNPAILAYESEDVYWEMLGQFGAECGADSLVEWFWVKDVADLTWQILRIRRWTTILIENGRRLGLAIGVDQLIGPAPQEKTATRQ